MLSISKLFQPMRPTGLLFALAAIAALSGCKKKVFCFGDLEKDDLFRLQERIEKGEEVCAENRAPRVAVDFSGIGVNGRNVAPWSSLPDGEIKRVAPLFSELKILRENWKQLYPGRSFDSDATVEIAGDIDALAGVSTLLSLAYAGFPRMQVKSGETRFDAYWAVPGPPRPVGDTEEGPDTLHIGRTLQDWYELRIDGPAKKPRPAGWTVRELPALADALSEACASREGACAQIVEIQVLHGTFLEVARLVRMVLYSPAFARRYPTLRLTGPGSP